MNTPLFKSFTRILPAVPLLFGMWGAASTGFAATQDQIDQSIEDGIAWLVASQNADGSWGGYYGAASTCFSLIKLQDRAFELGFDSPFDEAYPFSAQVLAGWQYVLTPGRTGTQSVPLQPAGDPDVNGNGYGVYFAYDTRHRVYTTGICMMAMASTGDPDRKNDGGLDFDADTSFDTYGQLMQDAVDWMAMAQSDGGSGRGGWRYDPYDNFAGLSDNSISGYAVLGMAAAQNFGASVPQWVKDELNIWIDYIQDDTTGASGYEAPWSWQNVLKTGNLLFEMTFVGDPCTTPRYQAALAYIEGAWQAMNTEPGWGYGLATANYQAMFSLMKAFEYAGLDLIDTNGDTVRDNDWFNQEPPASPPQDFASVLVAQQNADGSWPSCYWGDIQLCTVWALLTIEKIAPDADPFEVTVEKDYRYTSVCFERDNDFDGLFNEDPVDFDPSGLPIDNDGDGLFNEDDVDCAPSDTGQELPLTGLDPEAYTVEAVLKKNGKVSSYNPGQYYAVSTVELCRNNDTIESVLLTIEEDFAQCTVSDYPLSVLNPRTGGGSVVVVEVKDGVAYQIFDAMSGAVTIDFDGDLESMATAEFEYTFEPDQKYATLMVYVKFGPGLKGLGFEDAPTYLCENFNRATLDVFDDPEDDPVFTASEEANAWLKVVEK